MLYLGFDCHKRFHTWALVDEGGGLVDQGSVRNEPQALHELRLRLARPVCVALEGSRGYRVALHRTFRDVACYEICAAWTHEHRRRGRPKPKTDKHDARVIARALAEDHPDLVPLLPPQEEREALEITLQLWRQAAHDRTATRQRCHALLTRLWQGCYKDLFRDPLAKTARAFFRTYPHPQAAARARRLAERLHAWSHGRIGTAHAERILETARSFPAPSAADQLTAEELRELLDCLESLEQKQERLRVRLQELLRALDCEWLLAEPGIAAVQAAALVDSGLLESPGDNGFAKLAGIAPERFQSGETTRDYNTRVRHPDLFATLMEWASWQATSPSGPAEARSYYTRKRAEGKSHAMALRCVARQLIRRLFKLRNQARGPQPPAADPHDPLAPDPTTPHTPPTRAEDRATLESDPSAVAGATRMRAGLMPLPSAVRAPHPEAPMRQTRSSTPKASARPTGRGPTPGPPLHSTTQTS